MPLPPPPPPRIRRYYLPPWSAAAVVVRARCASAQSEVSRLPVACETVDGEPALLRVRSERSVNSRFRHDRDQGRRRSLALELDLPARDGAPARRVDLRVPAGAASVNQWLAALGREYVSDDAVVGRGHWNGAHLTLEDRGGYRLLVEVTVADGATWDTPAEWSGAIEVTDRPEWARPVLTAATWPVVFAPVGPQPEVAWGAALDPTPATCDLPEPDPEYTAWT